MIKVSEKELTRRGFITRVGQGLVAANVAAPLLNAAMLEHDWAKHRRARDAEQAPADHAEPAPAQAPSPERDPTT